MIDKWIEIIVQVPVVAADLVCNEFYELGSVGVVVEERELDTFIPPDPDETDAEFFAVKAYFTEDSSVQLLRQQVAERLRGLSEYFPALADIASVNMQFGTMAQQDWAEDWKQHFSATRIGTRLIIKPSWEDYSQQSDDVVVTLDPGMAFGTGTHGTTHLCLETLAALFDHPASDVASNDTAVLPSRILDVGTGSGILSIAAAALGATEVLACDIDPEACEVAKQNIADNNYSDVITVTDALLDKLPDNYDVILANILAEENIRLATQLVERLANGGTLILSGILEEKVELVTTAFNRFAMHGPELYYENEWACIVYKQVD